MSSPSTANLYTTRVKEGAHEWYVSESGSLMGRTAMWLVSDDRGPSKVIFLGRWEVVTPDGEYIGPFPDMEAAMAAYLLLLP